MAPHPSQEKQASTQPRPASRSSRVTAGSGELPGSSRSTPRPSTSRAGQAQWATEKQVARSSAGSLVDELDSASDSDSDVEGEAESDTDDAPGRRQISPSVAGTGPGEAFSKHGLIYVLTVVQQPQRARACGFGDKDRRPLSPPPIIQLQIYDKAGNTIAPHLVDFHRLILMVDLWNSDQTQQRSIVMHPGARPDAQSMYQPSRTPSQPHRYDAPPQSTFSRTPHHSVNVPGTSAWPNRDWDTYGRMPQQPGPYGHMPSGSSSAWPPPPGQQEQASWSGSEPNWYESRRASSSTRPGLSHADSHRSASGETRIWTPEPSSEYSVERGLRPASAHPSTSDWGREPRDRPHTSGYTDWERYPPSSRPWSASGDTLRSRSTGGPLFTHAPSPISHQSPLPLTASPPSLYQDAYAERVSTTSHYSRVLVGSLGAVCQRLKGLDGQTGLYFFTHDLGIRTEGTFSLRFTLVDLSSLMGTAVSKDHSVPTLARVSSDTFTVYSAKRFPGVLPTTQLTQCFADQSVRLPTRQKRGHTSSEQSAKRKK